jgi:hypothetical protein
MSFTLKLTCVLSQPMGSVWQKVSTIQGVNDELRPLLRMTAPLTAQHLPFTQAPLHQVLFPSGFFSLDGYLLIAIPFNLRRCGKGDFVKTPILWFIVTGNMSAH